MPEAPGSLTAPSAPEPGPGLAEDYPLRAAPVSAPDDVRGNFSASIST